MHLRCPRCDDILPLVDDKSTLTTICPSCQSTFRVSSVEASFACQITEGSKVAEFRIQERLGTGGHGMVFRAHDTKLDRTVAIKIPRFIGKHSEEQELFVREARAMAQLNHENIVRTLGVGRSDDLVFIVNDFIDGVTLSAWRRQKARGQYECVDICIQIARALEHAHQAKIVHRDLKPSNVMVDATGHVSLMDFGLATRDAEESISPAENPVVGTPAYMSPEQAFGLSREATSRSDVYSLGVIMFELLAGERPFRGNLEAVLQQVRYADPQDIGTLNTKVSKDLNTIVMKCLEKNPSRRFESAQTLCDELVRWRDGRPILSRPVGAFERGLRWTQRNRCTAALVTFALLSLVGGSIVSMWFAKIARREAASAAIYASRMSDSNIQSMDRLESALDAIDKLLENLAEQSFDGIPGGAHVRRDLIFEAVQHYDLMLVSTPDHRRLLASCAEGHLRLAAIEQKLGNATEAQREVDVAYGLAENLEPCERRSTIFSSCLRRRSNLHQAAGDLVRGRELAIQSISVLMKHCDEADRNDAFAEMSAGIRGGIARSYLALGRLERNTNLDRSIECLELARVMLQRLVSESDSDYVNLSDLMRTTIRLSTNYQRINQNARAMNSVQETIDVARPSTKKRHPFVLDAFANLTSQHAKILNDMEQFEDSREAIGESIAIQERLVADYPMIPSYQLRLANSYIVLGRCANGRGHHLRKYRHLEKSLRLRQNMENTFGQSPTWLRGMASSHRSLGAAYKEDGRSDDAIKHFELALSYWSEVGKEGATVPTPMDALAISRINRNVARLYTDQQEFELASSHAIASLEIVEEVSDAYPRNPAIAKEMRLSQAFAADVPIQSKSLDVAKGSLVNPVP